jgi:CRISPR-associated protein Csy1
LLEFLDSDPARNLATRERRGKLIDMLIDEFFQFSAELRSLAPGWSQLPECRLSSAQKHWLDPDGVEQAMAAASLPMPADTAEKVSAAFANWLNGQMRTSLPAGDPEYSAWHDEMFEQIKADERERRNDN